jgi:hypothetical protein
VTPSAVDGADSATFALDFSGLELSPDFEVDAFACSACCSSV